MLSGTAQDNSLEAGANGEYSLFALLVGQPTAPPEIGDKAAVPHFGKGIRTVLLCKNGELAEVRTTFEN